MSDERSPLTIVLLVVHIFGVVLFIGPTAAAGSIFPQYLRGRLSGRSNADRPFEPDERVMLALHRITFRYGRAAILVPAAGAGLAVVNGAWDEPWLFAGLAMTAVAAALLAANIAEQRQALALVRGSAARQSSIDEGTALTSGIQERARRAGTRAGQFNMAWLIVLVLMVWRPGS